MTQAGLFWTGDHRTLSGMAVPLLPDMTDLDAAAKLEGMLVLGVYKAFRANLRARPDLKDVAPPAIDRNRDFGAFWSWAKGFDPSWEPRRRHIRDTFAALFDRLEAQATTPPSDVADSSRWTGRRTTAVQARVVLSLAPDAMSALEEIVERLELPFHNGGPRDPQVDQALAALRELHGALGELLEAARQGLPLDERLGALRSKGRGVFLWSTETFGMTLGGLPLAGTTTALACGVSKILTVMAGMPLAQAATIGVGAAAANAALVVKKASDGTAKRRL
jgi:hypothetical protein